MGAKTTPANDLPSALRLSAALGEDEAEELAKAFQALADPVRLRLLALIAGSPGCCACSCDLEAPVRKSQPTVSYHLSLLADAGLITKRKQGRWVMCSIVPNQLAALRRALGDQLLGDIATAHRLPQD